jgi:hypothetical protein
MATMNSAASLNLHGGGVIHMAAMQPVRSSPHVTGLHYFAAWQQHSLISCLMGEEWRSVVGWEGFYEVSNLGRVKTAPRTIPLHGGQKRIPERVRKLQLTRDGYPCVGLSGVGKWTLKKVHQLVCEAFHGPRPSPSHQAAHNDGVRTNNAASNLRWATAAENSCDRAIHGNNRPGETNGNAKLTNMEAAEIRLRAHSASYAELADEYGVSLFTIGRIVRCERYRVEMAA